MSDLPGKIRATSLHLSHILVQAGVSERIVKKTQQSGLKIGKLHDISLRLKGQTITGYLLGSKIEGTSTRELNPDMDQILCFDNFNVIQEKTESKWGQINLLVHQGDGIPAGHCRLEILPGYVLPENRCSIDMLNNNLCRIGDRVFVKNTVIDYLKKQVRHIAIQGPAIVLSYGGLGTGDSVLSFKCDSISKQMCPRIEVMRTKTCPVTDLLDTADINSFFVVPVGHRLSKGEDRKLEWRVSPSLIERSLMFGMNITHIQCYVILKMLKNELIFPRVGAAISSFHLKTILFHCVEITQTDFWTEENLLLCVNLCIYLLMNFIKDRCCPNYLIPTENLFLGKIKDEQYLSLEILIAEIMESNGEYLFDIQCNQLGQKLRERHRLHDVRSIKTVCDIVPEERLKLMEYEYASVLVPLLFFHNILSPSRWTKQENISCFINLKRKIKYILLDRLKCSDLDTVSAATALLATLHSTYGSQLSSWCIRAGISVSKGSISFLERGYASDLSSGRLKHASVVFCCNHFDKAAQILECLGQEWEVSSVASVCFCHNRIQNRIPQAFFERLLSCKTESEKRKLLACDIKFTIHEVYCCPQALRFELFRDVGDDRKIRTLSDIYWMDCAVVDSLIFLYFLLYMTYGKLGKRRLQLGALFGIIVHCDEELNHSETAYNLLGQCYEMEQRFDDALRCYRQSLQIRRRNNAAMWLVTLLVYKQFCLQRNVG